MTPGFLHHKDLIFFPPNSCLHFSPNYLLVVVMFTAVAPLVGVARKILAAGTKFSETSMAPSEVLAAGPTVATTRVGDIDGGPPKGCWQ
jgi:hypothetical protein